MSHIERKYDELLAKAQHHYDLGNDDVLSSIAVSLLLLATAANDQTAVSVQDENEPF